MAQLLSAKSIKRDNTGLSDSAADWSNKFTYQHRAQYWLRPRNVLNEIIEDWGFQLE